MKLGGRSVVEDRSTVLLKAKQAKKLREMLLEKLREEGLFYDKASGEAYGTVAALVQ